MHNEKSLAALFSEFKQEIKELLSTRVGILRAEVKEKVTTWKYVIPFFGVAAALLLAAWMSLTFALIALLHGLFMPSNFAWGWAALIVCAAYGLGGIAIGWFAYGEVKSVGGVMPTRTVQVLKEDQVWLQNEVRSV